MGLLVSFDAIEWGAWKSELRPGDNVQEYFGIEKYVPPSELKLLQHEGRIQAMRELRATKNPGFMPVYGVDAFRKYSHALMPGEEVVLTEKIHGCNARFCFKGGRLYVGSHRTMRGATQHRFFEWLERTKLKFWTLIGKKHRAPLMQEAGDVWWQAAREYDLKTKLAKHPGLVFYGEIYGERVQDRTYDSPKGRRLRFFDVYDSSAGRFLDYDEAKAHVESLGLAWVPELHRGGWDPELVSFAEGKSTLGPHIREGFVVRPVKERFDARVGRVSLKMVGQGYMLRQEAA
jgi:RNA ligase (TIGR02306 family)